MDLIYSMRRKPLKCEPPYFDSSTDTEIVRPLCTISTANIIAFSSPTELSDVDGDTWGGHVYVCDLDTPWNSYKVVSTSHPVSVLEWDIEGKQLLVGTTVGDVTVYGQKDYLLNDWQCLYTASFPGEHIIKSAFFHNGRRIMTLDKKSEAPITDRIQMLRSTPTLKGFGGVALEGACIITATGLVGALLPQPDSTVAVTTTEALRSTRDHVTSASVAYKNGNLVIAVTCAGPVSVCVRCYLCSVSSPGALHVHPLPAVSLADSSPVSLTWSGREDTDSLLIAGSSLVLWKCTERAHPVHKLLAKGPLQGSTTPGGGQKPGTDSFNTVIWQKTAMWPIDGDPCVCIASSRLPITGHYMLATRRSLHLLSRDSQRPICSRQVITSGTPGLVPEAPASASPPKKPKYGPGVPPSGSVGATVSHVEMSYLGGVAVCIDSHAQLHVYRVHPPWPDIPSPLSVQHASSLLEYSVVSGYDCLDILLTLKPNIIEPIYERLTETFQRQPPSFQQYYYHSWLKLKTALCRRTESLRSTGSSLTCVQMCHATLATCAANVGQERDVTAEDVDDEKTLVALEAMQEQISECGAAVQALRLPIQRALDTATTVIARYGAPRHGYDVWSEPGSLAVLRKLVCVGRGGDTLSRLLPRIQHAPRSDLYEECSALAAQSNARVWESLPRCAVSAPHGKPWPLYLEYGMEPESLRYTPEPPPYAQSDNVPPLAMDAIRYMYLGGAAKWRACSRCGARALPAAHTQRHPLQRAYDARFLPNCRCGGRWSLVKNI